MSYRRAGRTSGSQVAERHTRGASEPTPVWTIGHSTRRVEDLIGALAAYEIEVVADVRRFPGSRRLPQFSSGALEAELARAGIGYQWIGELGGRRRPAADSPNDAWRNASFRGYADFMATEEFATGLEVLVNLAEGARTAIMCAEVLWWRCHRRLIADLLTTLGYGVTHIRDARASEAHRIMDPGRVVRGRLVYAGAGVAAGAANGERR